MDSSGQRGVVLANTGSPSAPTPEAVRVYLEEFLTDPRIRPMRSRLWDLMLNSFILPKRSIVSAEKYAHIWNEDGSPLAVYMQSLACKLERHFDGHAIVRCAMSNGSPSIQEALSELQSLNCERITVVPLYPQSAFSTTNVVRDKLTDALTSMKWMPSVSFVDSYWNSEVYLNTIARSVQKLGFVREDSLLFAFHSIPMKDVRAGDTYVEQARATAAAIAERLQLNPDDWSIGFQCRFDSRRWVRPTVVETAQQLISSGRRLFVVAPNFAVDCLETLYDIDVVLRTDDAIKTAYPDSSFVYVPCLNDSDEQIAILKEISFS